MAARHALQEARWWILRQSQKRYGVLRSMCQSGDQGKDGQANDGSTKGQWGDGGATEMEGEESTNGRDGASDDSETLREKLRESEARAEEAEARAKEATERARRLMAEMDDVRERTRRDKERAELYASQGLAKDVLPVADNLSRALSSAEEEGEPWELLKGVKEGLKLTEKGLMDALERHGVKRFEPAVGDEFDPDSMEALARIPSDDDAHHNAVFSVTKAGFFHHDRVLRPAQVAVSIKQDS